MFLNLRGTMRALLAALVLITILATTAQAESWSSSKTFGLTSVETIFRDGSYSWLLKNDSSSADSSASWDVLVWSLTPYQVQSPLSVSTPPGWTWTGGGWEVKSNSDKYFTPYSLGPGQSLAFQYTPDPHGGMINAKGPQPEQMGFIAHVAAVVPSSGTVDGVSKWIGADTPYGKTWSDQVKITPAIIPTVPEPKGVFLMALGLIGMVLTGMRRSPALVSGR